MATPRPFNRGGIWGIKSVGTPTVTDTDITLHFEPHPLVRAPYNGLLIVQVTTGAPIGGDGTLPVYFQTGAEPKYAVYKEGGVPLTAADILATGYLLLFFDRGENILQVIKSVA